MIDKIALRKLKNHIKVLHMPKTFKAWKFFEKNNIKLSQTNLVAKRATKSKKSMRGRFSQTEYNKLLDIDYRRESGGKKHFLDKSTRVRKSIVNDIVKSIKSKDNESPFYYSGILVFRDNDEGEQKYQDYVTQYAQQTGYSFEQAQHELGEKEHLFKFHHMDFSFISKKHKDIYYNAEVCTMTDVGYWVFEEDDTAEIKSFEFYGFVAVDKDYRYGIGIRFYLPQTENLTIESIEKLVQSFWEYGELEQLEKEQQVINPINYSKQDKLHKTYLASNLFNLFYDGKEIKEAEELYQEAKCNFTEAQIKREKLLKEIKEQENKLYNHSLNNMLEAMQSKPFDEQYKKTFLDLQEKISLTNHYRSLDNPDVLNKIAIGLEKHAYAHQKISDCIDAINKAKTNPYDLSDEELVFVYVGIAVYETQNISILTWLDEYGYESIKPVFTSLYKDIHN